jgi:hypothetical protein
MRDFFGRAGLTLVARGGIWCLNDRGLAGNVGAEESSGEVIQMRAIRYIFLPLLAFVILAVPSASSAQIGVGVSIRIGPPALPVYTQPLCPGDGYIWTPGYWAYGPDGYYWVPGTWVLAPTPGFLWTPGYWGWGGGAYLWHAGYWGPHVGFYGGINYGFGYVGVGYVGGRWNNGVFAYNTAVNNVNVTNIHNTYVDKTVINIVTVNRVSYNGGTGGTNAQPTAQEQAVAREQHVQPTAEQSQHEQAARGNRAQLASENHGQPAVAATARPGAFTGEGVVRARGAGGPNNGAYRPPAGGARGNAAAPAGNSVRANPPRANNQAAGRNANGPRPNASRPNGQQNGTQHPKNKPQGGGGRGEGGEKNRG